MLVDENESAFSLVESTKFGIQFLNAPMELMLLRTSKSPKTLP